MSSAEPQGADSARIAKLTEADVPRAVELLARAFDNDPFIDWVARPDAKREEAIRMWFDVCLRRLTLPFGEVWVTGDFSGVSMWTPPGTFKVSLADQLRSVGQYVRGMQLRRMPARFAAFDQIERHHPKVPHFYLFFLGVDPERQGEGIGSRMMTNMLQRCDAENMPAYLEATHTGLIPFYARLGYQTLEPIALRFGGPVMYPMWREPSARVVAGREEAAVSL